MARHREGNTTRRAFLSGAIGALAMAGLTGCGTSRRSSQLTFYLQKQEVIGYFQELLREFEAKNPGARVTHDSTTEIAPQFVRHKPCDVGCFNGNLELARYIERGVLDDLSTLPSADRVRQDFQELIGEYGTYPGRLSALPYSLAAAGVIYNKEIFDEHGLSVPTTWTEFVDICEELQSAEVTPIYATDRDTWTIWQGLFDYSVGSSVNTGEFFSRMQELGTDVGPDSEVSFEKTLAEPMERAKTISNFFNPDHPVRGYADGNLAFGQGGAAMYLQGPWALGEIALVNADLDVGTFALPVSEDPNDREVRVNVDLSLWIPSGAENKDQAADLVEFLMQDEVINTYNADNLAYSPIEEALPQEDERLSGLQSYVDDGAFYQGVGTFIPPSIPLGNYLQDAVRSGNFEAMLRQLDDDWRRIAGREAIS